MVIATAIIITVAIVITITGYKNDNMLSNNSHSLNIVGLERQREFILCLSLATSAWAAWLKPWSRDLNPPYNVMVVSFSYFNGSKLHHREFYCSYKHPAVFILPHSQPGNKAIVHRHELHSIKGNQFCPYAWVHCWISEFIIPLQLLSLHSSCTEAWNVRQNTSVHVILSFVESNSYLPESWSRVSRE